ncbi:HTH domain-containing protein [Haloferacaceae archaeon DSL9]
MINECERRPFSVKLFVRANPEPGIEAQKEAVVGRLSELDRSGSIETYDVRVWGSAIRRSGPLEGTDFYEDTFSHLEAFQRWADGNGVAMNFAFKERQIDCSITDEAYSVLSLPSMCLAVYAGDDLCGVYPHCEGSETRSIRGVLETLDADE